VDYKEGVFGMGDDDNTYNSILINVLNVDD